MGIFSFGARIASSTARGVFNTFLPDSGPAEHVVYVESSDDRPRRPCPTCKEYILVGAARCSFCGDGITWSTPQKQIAFSECPYCGYKGDVEVGAMQCPGRHDFGCCPNHYSGGMMGVYLTAAVGGTYCKKCNKNVVNDMRQKMQAKTARRENTSSPNTTNKQSGNSKKSTPSLACAVFIPGCTFLSSNQEGACSRCGTRKNKNV